MRDVDLRGKTTVSGVPLDEYVKKLVSGCSSLPATGAVSPGEIEKIVSEKTRQLDSFNDEKVMLVDKMADLTKKMSTLEQRFEELNIKVGEMKPKRGVDQATLDASLQDLKNEFIDKLQELRSELEEEVVED